MGREEHAFVAGEIDDGLRHLPTMRFKERADVRELAGAEFAGEEPAWFQKRRASGSKGAIWIEAIHATIERPARFAENVTVQGLDFGSGDVGRVGEDGVEWRVRGDRAG